MAFVQRLISLRFILGKGDFGTAGQDTVDVSGLRCSVNIVKQGIGQAQCDIQAFGMSLDLMNKLTVLNKLRLENQRFNSVIVSAGNDKGGLGVCFKGTIQEAWADGRQAPDVAFQVSADTGLFQLLQPVAPISFNGSVDIVTVLSGIATQMGLVLENNGVTGTVENPYFPGTLKSQLEKACVVGDCTPFIDEAGGILAVTPRGKARGGLAILLSKDTGLVSYPSFTQSGIQVTSIFNPNLEFGRQIRIDSQFKPANGLWRIQSLAHRLESQVPGGQWFTDIECTYFDQQAQA